MNNFFLKFNLYHFVLLGPEKQENIHIYGIIFFAVIQL